MQEFLPIANKEWINYGLQLKMKFIIPAMILSLIFLLLIPLVSAETTFFEQDDAFIMGDSATEGSIGGSHNHDDSEILCEYNMTMEFDTAAEYENNEEKPVEIPSTPKTETPETESQESGDLVTGALTGSPIIGDAIYVVLALILIVVLSFVVRFLEEK